MFRRVKSADRTFDKSFHSICIETVADNVVGLTEKIEARVLPFEF
jgi:hypothetical protein